MAQPVIKVTNLAQAEDIIASRELPEDVKAGLKLLVDNVPERDAVKIGNALQHNPAVAAQAIEETVSQHVTQRNGYTVRPEVVQALEAIAHGAEQDPQKADIAKSIMDDTIDSLKRGKQQADAPVPVSRFQMEGVETSMAEGSKVAMKQLLEHSLSVSAADGGEPVSPSPRTGLAPKSHPEPKAPVTSAKHLQNIILLIYKGFTAPL